MKKSRQQGGIFFVLQPSTLGKQAKLSNNVLSTIHLAGVSMSHAVSECIYLGNDWLLYATTKASHDFAQMIAPCLILSPAEAPMQFETEQGQRQTASHLVHDADTTSRGEGELAAFVYVDPASHMGRAIQALTANQGIVALDKLLAPESAHLRALANRELSTDHVSAWVGTWLEMLTQLCGQTAPIDARIRTIASAIQGKTEGRPELEKLAKRVHLSPDSLRRLFAQQTGMTLSRYQMWQRIRHMIHHACQVCTGGNHPLIEEMIFAAGFYDTPHAAKNFRRFFGKPASSINAPISFLNCPPSPPLR